MTTADYLINATFVLIVLPQARERELDRRTRARDRAQAVRYAYQHGLA